jgi:acetyl/propionyl-CoA carboxylase alpha subunit
MSNEVQKLMFELMDASADGRLKAKEAFVTIGASAVEPLCKLLANPFEFVVAPAAETLVRIGPPAVERLIKALEDEKSARNSGSVLSRIGSPAVEPLIWVLGNAALAKKRAPTRSRGAR